MWNLFEQSMQHDFCPWANHYVYWLKRPIGWVVVALLSSLLLGFCVSSQAFIGSAAILALGGIGCLWPWIAMQAIRGDLSWSQLRCEEGETILTRLNLVNPWPWPVWGVIVEADDAIASHIDAPGQPICLSRIPGLSKSQFEWQCRPAVRGLYPKQVVRLSTGFPFGIWFCHRDLTVLQRLIVWPRTVRLIDVPEHLGTPNSGIGSTSDRIGDEGDWMGVRPYRPGDSLRQVHWAQTSRRDSLVVFERQSRSRQTVSIWLDCDAAAAEDTNEREWMVRSLASMANHFLSHAWMVRVHIDDAWTTLHCGHTSKHQWMDGLAAWQPSDRTTSMNGQNGLMPSTGTGLCIAISTTDRASHKQSAMNGKDRLNCLWLLTKSQKTPDANQSLPLNPILLDTHRDPESQLQSQWQRICQRASRIGCLS